MKMSLSGIILTTMLTLWCVWREPCMAHHEVDQEVAGCAKAKTTSVKFSVNSHRNRSGHWVSKIQVHLSPEDNNPSGRWSVDVEQSTVECNGFTSLKIDADITSPPQQHSDYELFPGVGYYKFHNTPMPWAAGKKVCEDEGAHLAVINSEEESATLRKLFSQYTNITNAYDSAVAGVGFHDQVKEGEYVTIFGESLYNTGFHRWSPIYNSPDNFRGSATNPGEDCGSIYRDGLLNDIDCNVNIVFICEQEL